MLQLVSTGTITVRQPHLNIEESSKSSTNLLFMTILFCLILNLNMLHKIQFAWSRKGFIDTSLNKILFTFSVTYSVSDIERVFLYSNLFHVQILLEFLALPYIKCPCDFSSHDHPIVIWGYTKMQNNQIFTCIPLRQC